MPPPAQLPPTAGVAPLGAPQTGLPASEYDETIVARSQVGASVAIAVILAVVLIAIRLSLWPFAILVLLAVGGVGVYLAGVSVAATRTYVEIGQGRRERNPRRISNFDIIAASTAELTWAQVFASACPASTARPAPRG